MYLFSLQSRQSIFKSKISLQPVRVKTFKNKHDISLIYSAAAIQETNRFCDIIPHRCVCVCVCFHCVFRFIGLMLIARAISQWLLKCTRTICRRVELCTRTAIFICLFIILKSQNIGRQKVRRQLVYVSCVGFIVLLDRRRRRWKENH